MAQKDFGEVGLAEKSEPTAGEKVATDGKFKLYSHISGGVQLLKHG